MSSGHYLTSGFYYFNLGCHMLYILRNRLEAQNIRKQKIIRILQDISNAIFKELFIANLVLPQDPFNVNTLKDMFGRLAHSSVMKLDQSSMDKMFYLMLLSVKKEVFLLSSPLELYTLTLSHLLNIAKQLQGTQSVENIQFAISTFQKYASKYSFIQYLQIRSSILSQLQRYQTKIVNFIESQYQSTSGKMIFRVRNSHNQKSIGAAINQQELDCVFTKVDKDKELMYQDWMKWRTSLVIDFVEDYRKASERRNSSLKGEGGKSSGNAEIKEKGLGDLLNLKIDDIENFEVTFDLFENDTSGKSKAEDLQIEGSSNVKKIASNVKPKANNQFKSGIQKQFADLKFDKKQQEQQQPDLLDMMDN